MSDPALPNAPRLDDERPASRPRGGANEPPGSALRGSRPKAAGSARGPGVGAAARRGAARRSLEPGAWSPWAEGLPSETPEVPRALSNSWSQLGSLLPSP